MSPDEIIYEPISRGPLYEIWFETFADGRTKLARSLSHPGQYTIEQAKELANSPFLYYTFKPVGKPAVNTSGKD